MIGIKFDSICEVSRTLNWCTWITDIFIVFIRSIQFWNDQWSRTGVDFYRFRLPCWIFLHTFLNTLFSSVCLYCTLQEVWVLFLSGKNMTSVSGLFFTCLSRPPCLLVWLPHSLHPYQTLTLGSSVLSV